MNNNKAIIIIYMQNSRWDYTLEICWVKTYMLQTNENK